MLQPGVTVLVLRSALPRTHSFVNEEIEKVDTSRVKAPSSQVPESLEAIQSFTEESNAAPG